MTSNHDTSTDHKRFLLQLSDRLNKDDSKKIVFLEGLPKGLEDKETWEVLAHLEVLGKTATDELTRILKDIKRPEVAKWVKDTVTKNRKTTPLTKKNSGLKLGESLSLTLKHCEVLQEQLEYLKLAASTTGKKRIEELISEAKGKLTDNVHRKLKVAHGLLASESQETENSKVGLSATSSPPSSPTESSLTVKIPEIVVPKSPMRQRTHLMFNDSDLRKAAERLKPAKHKKGEYFSSHALQ